MLHLSSYYNQYSPAGDILVIATCIVFFILMRIAYISRTKSFLLFRNLLALLCVAAVSDILFYVMLHHADVFPHFIIYLMRAAYHITLLANLQFYLIYIKDTLLLSREEIRPYFSVGGCVLALSVVFELISPYFQAGFYIDAEGTPHNALNIFPLGYMIYMGMIAVLMVANSGRIYLQIVRGVGGAMCVSFMIMLIQGYFGQNSYTASTFLFPAFAILYLLHSNPYDFETGSISAKAFEDTVTYSYEQKSEFFLMYLSIPDFETSGEANSLEVKKTIRGFVSDYFHKAVLFSISAGQFLLTIETAKDPAYREKTHQMLDFFEQEYPKYQKDYKIIFTKTYDEISRTNDYLSLLHYMANRMADNEFHEITDEDVTAFREHEYILSELADIQAKQDMDDPRVLVFCQPVYNIQTDKFDTAEALMRLKLDKTGMVFPDRFIPMAEKYNYIRTLSMIILSKSCKQIKNLLNEGYAVTRVSVNFSVLDIRDVNFCKNVDRIISSADIPYDKIAIEITESQSEKDFLVMKEKVLELQHSGIKFYLDDFGTGYSNYERILELPFDIIKFDRSLTIASGNDLKSETMVNYLAHLFSDMGYAVLYEGIEDDADEERCLRMCAKYLQGYKYSRPIPIEQLTDFFEQSQAPISA